MSLGNDGVVNLIVAVLLLIGTWITARATKSNTKVQAQAQLQQVDQSAYSVAEGVFTSAINQLKAENKQLREQAKELNARLLEQEKEINILKGLIKNVD